MGVADPEPGLVCLNTSNGAIQLRVLVHRTSLHHLAMAILYLGMAAPQLEPPPLVGPSASVRDP